MEHIYIILILVVILIFLQLYSYISNIKKIKQLDRLFENIESIKLKTFYIPVDEIKDIEYFSIKEKEEDYLLKDYDNLDSESYNEDLFSCAPEKVAVQLISDSEGTYSPTFTEIIESMNNYLLRNQNSAGDFALMKDIVERNCAKFEEEIEEELPIPLYLGLMGTMLGIIVGIGYIAFRGGGFAEFIKNPTNSIGDLMSGIAVAMIASFIGIYFTTRGTVRSKNAKVGFESEKNEFYTWLQTNLLPVVNQTVGSTLATLQRNLTTFNDTFRDNVAGMERTLGETIHSLGEQKELIKLINQLDVKKIATANVTVLQELQLNIEQFQKFNKYITSINECMTGVTSATQTLSQLIERTNGVEEMVAYFKKENEAIEQRKSAISVAIGKVDEVLKQSFEDVSRHATSSSEAFKSVLSSQLTASQEIVEAVNRELRGCISKFQDSIQLQAEYLQSSVDAQSENMTGIVNELKQFSSIKDSIDKQNEMIGSLCDVIRKSCQSTQTNAISQVGSSNNKERDVNPIIIKTEQPKNGLTLISSIVLVIILIMCLLMFLKAYFGIDLMNL